MNYTEKSLSPRQWMNVRNPFRVLLNGAVCELCKYIPSYRFKNWLYRRIGVKIGKGVVIAPHVQIDPFFPEKITIKEGAVIGWGGGIFAHEFSTDTLRTGPVVIGENAVIGGNTFVRPGITVGENAVIGVGSWVYKDVNAGERVGGNPMKQLPAKEDR